MDGSGSGGKIFGRFTEQAHRVLDLARAEAERGGHRYLGPEHVLLGLLAESHSRAAQALWAAGVELATARAALARLGNRGVVPAPRPSDAELLGSMGIDLDAVRHQTEQTFGFPAVGEATWRVTRRPWWRGARVVWTPLLLGVLEDARQPADNGRGSRRHRQIIAHVGLPDGYQGAAGLLLAALEVDADRLREAVTAELGGIQR
jgi:hypothetical protein